MGRRTRRLNLFAGTFNANGRAPEPCLDLSPWLLPKAAAAPVDVYMLGLQEVQNLSGVDAVRTDAARGAAWRVAVEALLGNRGYRVIAERQLVGIFVLVLVAREHQPFVSGVALSYAGTGFLNVAGNKGAVAARFKLYDRTVACVACHLSAHDANVDRRNQDFRFIVDRAMFAPADYRESDNGHENSSGASFSSLPSRSGGSGSSAYSGLAARIDSTRLTSSSGSSGSGASSTAAAAAHSAHQWIGSFAAAAAVAIADANAGTDSKILSDPNALNILDHDAVFWLGDLNYRIDAPPERVVEWIEASDWESLCKADQLARQMKYVPTYRGFLEAPIEFPPTYKFERYTDKYSRDESTGALKRTPAYTDRILYRCGFPEAAPSSRPDLKPERYSSAKVYSSDHRPVYACFSMTFVHDEDELPSPPPMAGRSLNSPRLGGYGGLNPSAHPSIRLSERKLSLGRVRYDYRATTQLVVSNDGSVPVSLSLHADTFPTWLSLKDKSQHSIATLQPGKSVTFVFVAHVTVESGISCSLTSGDVALDTALGIQINRGVGPTEGFEVKGRYVPTCLGTSLDFLAMRADAVGANRSKRPSARDSSSHNPMDIEKELRAEPSLLPLACPKEIWWLVDLLWRPRDDEMDRVAAHDSDGRDVRRWIDQERFRRVFLATGDLDIVDLCQEHVDHALAMPPEVDALAVGTCLLNILRSLEDSVIPFSAYSAAVEVAKKREPAGVTHLLTRIPSLHGNVFRYIISVLRELPSVADGTGVSDLCDIFGEVLLASGIDRPSKDLRERSMFIRLALVPDSASGPWESRMAVVDLGKSSIAGAAGVVGPSHGAAIGSRGGHMGSQAR